MTRKEFSLDLKQSYIPFWDFLKACFTECLFISAYIQVQWYHIMACVIFIVCSWVQTPLSKMIPPFGLPTSQFSFLNFFDCLSLLEARNNLILSTIRRYCYRKQALLSTFLLYIYIRVLYKNGYIVLSITYYNTFGTSNHFLSISSITFGTGNYFRIVA